MHIVTFYSFKGGSGRSMALVNVAAELAKSGQKVLIVDFDLEAPGLDTFKLLSPTSQAKGIVDFVNEYLETRQAPDAKEFIYDSQIPDISGKLWVMPAGLNDENYAHRFRSINWRTLYEDRDGYFLFEDLKAQWKTGFNPDYVLIDSRTGHTDMGGICTRQLPNAVFLFIFPTEQNKRGLRSVVERIRAEAFTQRKKEIKLHLVFANVPDLDDEESYIADSIDSVQQCLKFDSPSAVIHHYSSVFLLTQPIFTLERPRTKLAREYQELTKAVRSDNLKDRTVALEFLESLKQPSSRTPEAEELDNRLKEIEDDHGRDPEILVQLAAVYRRLRRIDSALALLEKAGQLNASGSDFFLSRASLYLSRGKKDEALSDLRSVLDSNDATYVEVSAAARMWLFQFPDTISQLLSSRAFVRLADYNKAWLTNDLLQKREGADIAYKILAELLVKHELPSELRKGIDIRFSLACIASGKFVEAIDSITKNGKVSFRELDLVDTFNYAMARWGLDGSPTSDLFARVVELDSHSDIANVHQCLSLAFWTLGDLERANERLQKSIELVSAKAQPEFSCWSYLYLTRDEFLYDTDEMQSLYDGESIDPLFIRDDDLLLDEQEIG